MCTWIRLALKEFWLPFHYRKPGCPGGRDFVWLTIFMALLLTLMLLLLASREGLLNRFVDVLLGHVPGHGVPIAVTNNMLSKSGVNAIDSSVLAEIRALDAQIPGLAVYPYRSLEAGLYPLVSLPGEDMWNNIREDGSTFGPNFDGWAVYADDPLWSKTASSESLPLEIVINRSLFRTYFDESVYLKALQERLPPALLPAVSPEADNQQRLPLDKIWLEVKIGFRRELLPFQATWVERIPVIEKIAYLFPLTTYHALKAAHDFPELCYFPEGAGKSVTRITQFSLIVDQEQDRQRVRTFTEEFLTTFNAEIMDYRGDYLVSLKHPLPQFWIEGYVQQYDLDYQIIETSTSDRLEHDESALLIPCNRLPANVLKEYEVFSCSRSDPQPVRIDVTEKGKGYHHVLVYVPDRTFLSKAKDELVTVKEGALAIHPSYQDALNRFGFLSKMLEALEKPYSWLLGIFLFAFLGIQIGTLIGHHRHRYGILLAKGLEWWQIYAMLWLQIFLALLMGMIVALGVMTIMSLWLQAAVASVAQQYADTLSFADLNLLPFTWKEYLLVASAVFFTAWGLATLVLYFLPLRPRTHPAMLL